MPNMHNMHLCIFMHILAYFLHILLHIRCISGAYSMHIYCIFIAYLLHIWCIFCAYVLHISAYQVHIRCIFCAYFVHIFCIFRAYSLHIRGIFSAYICISGAYSVHILCIYFAYSLHIRCIYLHIPCIWLHIFWIYVHISGICLHIQCICLHICAYFDIHLHIYRFNLASPIPGHSGSITASPTCAPTTTDSCESCQHCMALSCPIWAAQQQAVLMPDQASCHRCWPGYRPGVECICQARIDHAPIFPAAGLSQDWPIHCHISNLCCYLWHKHKNAIYERTWKMLNICNNMQYHDKYAISWQICYIRNTLADGDGSAAWMKSALAPRRRLGSEDGDGSAARTAPRAAAPCVRSTNTVSVSEYLWNFKTLLHNSVISKWPVPTGTSYADPNPGHMAEVLWQRTLAHRQKFSKGAWTSSSPAKNPSHMA